MPRVARPPPVAGLALAAGAGATLVHLGAPLAWAPLPLLLLLLPLPPSLRPSRAPSLRPALALAFLAGLLLTASWRAEQASDCRLALPEGRPLRLRAQLVARPGGGRGEVRPLEAPGTGCREPLRAIFPEERGEGIAGGAVVELWGEWRRSSHPAPAAPLYSGYLRVDSLGPGEGGSLLLRLRGGVQERLQALFPREGALAQALVLARKEGLAPETREAFVLAGTAHLLAISGFHVGVVAGLLLLPGALLGLSHPARYLLSSLGVWGYVLAIGLPDAAVRAAVILTLLSLGRIRSRPVAPLGALATAFLLFLLLDPGALPRPGFQLSFAGALGLIVGARPVSEWAVRRSRGRLPRGIAGGIGAGVSATLATLPLVAWHFGRVSLVGIPATLLAAPLVTLAIPGIFASLLLSAFHPALGSALAYGVETLLALLGWVVGGAARLPLASVWISHPGVLAGSAGVLLAWVVGPVRRPGHRPGHRPGRRPGRPRLALLGALAGLLLWPAADRLLLRGTLEIVMLDVGQGDALALRSPGGRWLLVDAGPRSESFDAGRRRVLPYLRERGVGRVELLVLTHPDLDHVGGAPALLEEVRVGAVLDPGRAAGREPFLAALEAAALRGVPWRGARAGDSLNLDGVALRVVSPGPWGDEGLAGGGGDTDANDYSLVLEVRYGAFAALLTGDAPRAAEEELLERLLSSRIQLLKVGHHGSHTSTSPELLERIRPEVAFLSVGRRNRYGHPHPGVVRSLEEAGVRILRTDQHGTVRLSARRDGSYRILGPLTQP